MTLSLHEIESKAQELAGYLLVAGKQEALLLGIQIEGLRDLAQIMSTVAYRKEREAAPVPPQLFPYAPVPEPTKPAADRLHELVSWCLQAAEAGPPTHWAMTEQIKRTAEQAVYAEIATKLQDILQEGGI